MRAERLKSSGERRLKHCFQSCPTCIQQYYSRQRFSMLRDSASAACSEAALQYAEHLLLSAGLEKSCQAGPFLLSDQHAVRC